MSSALFTLGTRLVTLLALTAEEVAGLAAFVQTADNSIQWIKSSKEDKMYSNQYILSGG